MSCCGENSNNADSQSRYSAELQRKLQQWFKEDEQYVQMLLLGTGESGKTTILKQMKILHFNGYSDNERIEKRADILKNVQESIYAIIDNMTKIKPNIKLKNKDASASATFITNVGLQDISLDSFTAEYYDHINVLWGNSDVQKCYKRSNEYQLIESAGYFLDKLREIRQPDYVPTVQDILHCRVRTKGLSKLEFTMPVARKYGGGNAKFRMYDVGGQRGERRRWISVFEGINAVLFLIACSDFDQTLREDDKKNRLQESLELFRDIFWSRFLRKSGVIVFLNKQDIFKKKIEEGRRLDQLFPEYNKHKPTSRESINANTEYDRAKLFIRRKIQEIVDDKPEPEMVFKAPGIAVREQVENKPVYSHFTIATDTNNIKLVFNTVHEIILESNIKNIIPI